MRDLLPAGRHFAITWSVGDTYGGMTNALFHRSRAFIIEAATPIDVLTFDWRESYDPTREVLRQRGVLIDGLRLRNLWEELAVADPERLGGASTQDYPHFAPLVDPAAAAASPPASTAEGRTRRKVRFARDKKTVLQRDYFRDDGTLFASERCDIGIDELKGVRSIHLCDRDGAPIREFRTARSLYHFWLDLVTGREASYLIVDSKYSANFVINYRRDNVVTCYVAHGSHLRATHDSPYSALTASRGKVFRSLEDFDAIVLLTDRQRRDVRVRLGDMGNLHVIPNSHRYDQSPPDNVARDDRRGVMLASLTKRKQVDHAIMACADDSRAGPLRDIEIHVYGDGSERKDLEKLIKATGVGDSFFLEGFTDTPMSELQTSSFLLLTSSAEGFPLVLLEAMATGCIPIAYDMRYGPSQIIEHGVNGYLVAPGDTGGLRRCIEDFVGLPEAERTAMRKSAIERSSVFTDAKIVPLWGELFRAARNRKQKSAAPAHLSVIGASITMTSGYVTIDCEVSTSDDTNVDNDGMSPIAIAFRGRHDSTLLRSNATSVSKLPNGRRRVSVKFPNDAFLYLSDRTLDASIEAWIGGRLIKERIKSPDMFKRYAPYSTTHGNLSLEGRNTASATETRGRARRTARLVSPISGSRAMLRRMKPVVVAAVTTSPWISAALSRIRGRSMASKRSP